MSNAHYTTHSSRFSGSSTPSSSSSSSAAVARPSRPSDTFRPRGRLPLDPFAVPYAASYNGSGSSYRSGSSAYQYQGGSAYQYQNGSVYQNGSAYQSSANANAHASSSSSSAALSPSRVTQHPQRRDSASSTASGSGSAYTCTYEGVEHGQGYAHGQGHGQGQGQGYGQGAMWRIPRALVYGYDDRERERARRGIVGGGAGGGGGLGLGDGLGGRGQVVLVLGDPPAADLLPLLSSPHLADPTASLVLIATSRPPAYLLRPSTTGSGSSSSSSGSGSGSGRGCGCGTSGPGPAIRILRLAEPLDAHEGGALRLVSLFERAGRVVDAWRAGSGSGSGSGFGAGFGYRKGTGKDAAGEKRGGKGSYCVERIVQLAEDAQGEFVCVEAYRPAVDLDLDRSGSASKSAMRMRYPSPPSEEGGRLVTGNGNGVEQDKEKEKEKKKRFRFSLSMGSGSGSGSGSPTGVNGSDSDSPRPLMEHRMPTSSPPASPLSASFSSGSTANPIPIPKSRSPVPAPVSPYASRRLSQSSFSLSSSSSPAAFDAIVNFLPVQAPDKALLKHAILVSTLGAQYLGVSGQASTSSSGMAGPANPNIVTMSASNSKERNEGGAKLRKRPSRRLSMSQRLSGFFGMGGAGGDSEKALKELREMVERKEMAERKAKERQRQTSILSASAVPLHAHVVHILPPNMGNAQERPHGHRLVQGIEQFLLTFAYPLGSMLGGAVSGAGKRNSAYGYGYAGSSGSLSSLSSLGSVGVQLHNMGVNMGGGGVGAGTHLAFSSAPSSRNSSSSSLSAMGHVPHPQAHVYANSSQTLAQSQVTAGAAPVQVPAQAQVQAQHPRSRSLFSIGSPGGSRPASYFDGSSGKESDNGVVQKSHKPTTPPSAYPAPHMQRQRVRSSGASSSTARRPASMYSSSSTYGHANANNAQAGGVLGSGSGTLAQLAAQMAGRPVPYLVAPGVFGAPIGAVGGTRASGSTGARRMTYGEAILLGVLDWDSGIEGGVGAGMRGAGRAYVAWGDVVCDGEIEGEDAVEDEHVAGTESQGVPGSAGSVKHDIASTPRPAPTTTQLPTPPESSASSSESSVEGGDAESEATSVGDEKHDSDKTPRFSSTPRFTCGPSSSAHSGGSSGIRATEATSLTSMPHDPLMKPRTAEPAAGLACGTEANGMSAAGKDRGTETEEEAIIIGDPLPLASHSPSSALTSSPSPSVQERRRNHRPAPPPPSTPSPLFASMVAETQSKQIETPALPEMVRNDPLRMSVSAAPSVSPALTKSVGGVEMDRSHDQSHSQEGDVPFFSASSSAPIAEPPMMITLTSATVASPGQSQSGAVPARVTTNSSDSGYGSTESAGAHEAHATPLSHKAARPLHVSSTANPDLPEEAQKAVQDAVAKLVGESQADGRLSRRRSSSSRGKGNRRSQSKTRSPVLPKVASPAVAQLPTQQSPASNAKQVEKDVGFEVGKNGKLQGAWRKLGSWRRNGASSPAVDTGATPSV